MGQMPGWLAAHLLTQRHGQSEEGVGQSHGGKEGVQSDADHPTGLDLHFRQGELHEDQ